MRPVSTFSDIQLSNSREGADEAEAIACFEAVLQGKSTGK